MRKLILTVAATAFVAFLIFSFLLSLPKTEWNTEFNNKTDFRFINRTEFYPTTFTLELPKKVFVNFSIYVCISNGEVDEFHMDGVEWTFRNEGGEKVRIDRVAVYLERSRFERELNLSLDPGEERSFQLYSPPFPITLKKSTGMSVKGGVEIVSRDTIIRKNFTAPLPSMKVGEAVNNVAARNELSLAFLGWKESGAVVYSYKGSHYRFEAKPGMKFVVLALTLHNNGKDALFIDALSPTDGEIATDKGIYKSWTPDFSEKYLWKKDAKSLTPLTKGKIMPDESIVFHVAFEVPENERPLYASLSNVPAYLNLGKN